MFKLTKKERKFTVKQLRKEAIFHIKRTKLYGESINALNTILKYEEGNNVALVDYWRVRFCSTSDVLTYIETFEGEERELIQSIFDKYCDETF